MVSTIYPTGTTIYNPDKCWNGYTVFALAMHGATDNWVRLIDMNGNIINYWKNMYAFPPKVLPGGHLMGSTGVRNPKYGFQDMLDLIQVDWDGNIVWKFNEYELIRDPGQKPAWMARQHHDYQREGNPVGYYVPGMLPLTDRGNTLVLCHKNLKNPDISEHNLLDDAIVEVTWEGEIVWEWTCSDHFSEMGFSEEARNALARNPGIKGMGGEAMAGAMGDWMHINSMSLLGPNKWYDNGDERFHPDNIIWDGRQANIIAITDKRTGKIVWQLGPDYNNQLTGNLGQIVGQHHAHLIPQGLPGEGNILVFDNGGWAGYGNPNPGAPSGFNNALRDYSRILEFDPVTLKIVWQYTPREAGFMIPVNAYMLYSGFISSAQRLPNGNTLITEGAGGRIFEVTRQHEIVWEYVCPYKGDDGMSPVYRAYRVPYDWIPQAAKPEEKAIKRIDNSKYRVPGSPRRKAAQKTTPVKSGKKTARYEGQFCVVPVDKEESK